MLVHRYLQARSKYRVEADQHIILWAQLFLLWFGGFAGRKTLLSSVEVSHAGEDGFFELWSRYRCNAWLEYGEAILSCFHVQGTRE